MVLQRWEESSGADGCGPQPTEPTDAQGIRTDEQTGAVLCDRGHASR